VDQFTQYLMTDCPKGVSREQLMIHAKSIAAEYISGGRSLNDGLACVVKEASLNREQATRVQEMANSLTFRLLREKLAGNRGNIDFDVADINEVWPQGRELSYLEDAKPEPPKEKLASFAPEGEAPPPHIQGLTLLQVFGMEGYPEDEQEKTAHEKLLDYYDQVGPARELESQFDLLANSYSLVAQDCQNALSQALTEGAHPSEAIGLMKHAGLSLRSLGVLTSGLEDELEGYEEAICGDVVPNIEHPLYQLSEKVAHIERDIEGVRSSVLALDPAVSDEIRLLQDKVRFL